jgi:hypothetical protein
MHWKLALFATVLAAAFAVAPGAGLTGSARAACGPQDVIDTTTVAETKKKIEAAGYTQPTDLRKGCDNFWHASALKDGNKVLLVVTPTGEVIEEGN